MATFQNTVTIRRPVRDVFAFLADFENIPKWNYAIVKTEKTSPGPVGVGTTYRQLRSIPARSERPRRPPRDRWGSGPPTASSVPSPPGARKPSR